MLKLYMRGNVWWYRGTVRKTFERASTGTSDRQAAEAIKAKREAELLENSIFGRKATATFLEAAVMYLDAGGEKRFIERLVSHLGPVKLSDIKQAKVDEAARTLYPGCSNATLVRQVYVPVAAIMNLAAQNELCEARRFKRPKVKHKPRSVPDDEWWLKVLPECSGHLAALLLFLTVTGARISEATRLTWDDIDEEAGTALLRETKTRPRLVPIPQALWTRMAALPKYERVFRYTSSNSYRGALKRACERAGVPYHPSHEIGRHSFATELLRAGASLAHVKELGGWESGRLVTDRYGHLEPKDGRKLLEAIAARRSPKLKEVK